MVVAFILQLAELPKPDRRETSDAQDGWETAENWENPGICENRENARMMRRRSVRAEARTENGSTPERQQKKPRRAAPRPCRRRVSSPSSRCVAALCGKRKRRRKTPKRRTAHPACAPRAHPGCAPCVRTLGAHPCVHTSCTLRNAPCVRTLCTLRAAPCVRTLGAHPACAPWGRTLRVTLCTLRAAPCGRTPPGAHLAGTCMKSDRVPDLSTFCRNVPCRDRV